MFGLWYSMIRKSGIFMEKGTLLKVLKIVNNPFLPGMNSKSLSYVPFLPPSFSILGSLLADDIDLQLPRFQEAEIPASVEDDVIQQRNPHDDSCGLELLRNLNVERRRLKTAGWVIVGHDDRRGAI